MITYNVKFELVTPCISAGADQKNAEIRVPEIRAQLRTWLRISGIGRKKEELFFGKLGDAPHAGKIVVRLLGQNRPKGSSDTDLNTKFD